MSVSAAERDGLRERAFAMAMQRIPYRRIAAELGINKSTVVDYVRAERQRRSHDRDAENAVRDVVATLRASLEDLFRQLRETRGDGPHAAYAKARLGETIRKTARDLALVYGVALPKIDGEEIALDRLVRSVQAELDAPPIGFPDVSEDAALDRHLGLAYPVIAEASAFPDHEDDVGDYSFGAWDGVGEGYDLP